MAAVPDIYMELDGRSIAFFRRRLDPSELKILARYMRRVEEGMPTAEATTRFWIELGRPPSWW
jgi:hypothetical protein